MSTATVTTRQGDTVDALLWRERGRTAVVTEQVLALNPGLAAMGPVLPAGIAVAMPPVSAPIPVRETVKLWG